MRSRAALLLPACVLCIVLAAAFATSAPAAPGGERRTALVIGNGAYREGALKNPANDARDMAATLKGLGFDVTLLVDAGNMRMQEAVRDFGLKLRQGGVGLFYFAGHGVQVGGENYLVPVDAAITSESDVRFGCLNAGLVLGKMEDAGNALNVVILDACRNNPFARSFRSAEQGLAKMDAPTGSIIAYATAPGSVAADGKGRNGVYTEHLLRNLRTPGLPVTDLFMRVRMGVVTATGKKQVPWEASSLTGYFYFNGQGAQPAPPAPLMAAPAAPAPVPELPRLDPKAEKKRLQEEAAKLKREKEELAQFTALQAEKDRLEAERQKLEQAKLLALGGKPQQRPAAPAGGYAAHAAQFAQLARAGLPDARAYFEQAVQANPNDTEARAGLAIALVFSGREADAAYQVRRVEESGALTPGARLALGLVQGVGGKGDSGYQFNRAAEEGADRALVALCQATASERRNELDRGLRQMQDYAAQVPEDAQPDYARKLLARLDIVGRLAGVYDWKLPEGSDQGVFTFTRNGAVLSGSVDGFFNASGAATPMLNVRLSGRRLTFQVVRRALFNSWTYNFVCEVTPGADSIAVTELSYEGKKSRFAPSRLVRQQAQP